MNKKKSLPFRLILLYCKDNQLKYKGTTLEEIRKEQEKEDRKNIFTTKWIVFKKVKQEMRFCEEANYDWLINNILSHLL